MDAKTRQKIVSESAKCLSITVVSMLTLNFAVVIFAIFLNSFGDNAILLGTDLAMLISLVVIPSIMHAVFLGDSCSYHLNLKHLVEIGVLAICFVGLCRFYPSFYVLHFLVISFSEELFSRGIQFRYLFQRVGKVGAILITSILFAFVLHLNEGILENLFVRLPLGLILCFVRVKFGLAKSILLHWLYNLVVVFTL